MSIPDDAKLARYDDLANLVEELHDQNMLLTRAIRQALDENSHLADGNNCTLKVLKDALLAVGIDWDKEVCAGETAGET
jgi:hypothetical protein